MRTAAEPGFCPGDDAGACLAAEEIEQQITIRWSGRSTARRAGQHALDQHVRAVADQSVVSRWCRGLLQRQRVRERIDDVTLPAGHRPASIT